MEIPGIILSITEGRFLRQKKAASLPEGDSGRDDRGETLCGNKKAGRWTNIQQRAFGYIRVSTREQNEDRQMIEIRKLQIPEENIFMDKQSGKDFQRPQYQRMMKKIKKMIFFISKASTD